jgi:hypothetical protein
MNRLEFYVKGSAPEPYRVLFEKVDNNLNGYCTCPAGINGTYCKHRLNILYGVIDDILDPNVDSINMLLSWVPGTDVELALQRIIDAENDFKAADRRLKQAKKALSKALRT